MKNLIFWIVGVIISLVWMYILENIFGLNLTRFEHEHGGFLFVLLTLSPSIIFMVICFYIWEDDNSEETPKEIEPKTDNPEENEVIVVTEIHGTKKIIKNGKVIYSENLKADELQVFEKDKN